MQIIVYYEDNDVHVLEEWYPSLGDRGYFYSDILDTVIEVTVEGYASVDFKYLKVLEKVSDGYLRHIVHWSRMRPIEEEALRIGEELRVEKSNVEND